MMGITEMENELFRRWSQSRNGFVADGVADEDSYLASVPKLMFVLKEVNDPDGGGWDLREFMRQGCRTQTWDNITRWIIGIRNIAKDIPWKDLKVITAQQRIETIKSVCAINLKKSPGGHTTDNRGLAITAVEDKAFLNEQFSFYKPDIVVCCGTSPLFHSLINLDTTPNWGMTRRGIRWHEYCLNKYIIAYSHPEARVQDCLLYYGLVDAVREIL